MQKTDDGIDAKRLQWGRDLEVAERCRLLRLPILGLRRFNGAATWKSRKALRARTLASRPSRRFNGAATWKSRKVAGYSKRKDSKGRLQWGRDLEVAESLPSLLAVALGSIASMGPRLGSRGKSGDLYYEKGALLASMGPRLGSRGKNKCGRSICWNERASMGPRLGSRGKGMAQVQAAMARLASMGPRLGSRGKATCL